VSASGNDLPRVPTQDALPVAPEPKEPTVIGTIWTVGRWVVEQEILMRIVMVLVLVAIGVGGLAFAQDAGVKYVAPIRDELAAQRAENLEIHKRQALEREQDRADLATTKMQSAETMLNVRMLVERLNMKPIVLVEQPKDGGQ
jgi:hypothetical protein